MLNPLSKAFIPLPLAQPYDYCFPSAILFLSNSSLKKDNLIVNTTEKKVTWIYILYELTVNEIKKYFPKNYSDIKCNEDYFVYVLCFFSNKLEHLQINPFILLHNEIKKEMATKNFLVHPYYKGYLNVPSFFKSW